MKIKAVCEATGLTDRTVRYYIEEGLISPVYTENYLGRKAFDFTESDVQTLNDIAVLRKFGYSIAEIREMLLHPEKIIQISNDLKSRKQAAIDEERQLLQALSRLDEKHFYSVTELAEFLSAPVVDTSIPTEDVKPYSAAMSASNVKAVFTGLLTWLPVAFSALIIIDDLRTYHYPKVFPIYIVLTLLALLPTWLILLLPKIGGKHKWKSVIKRILLVLCVLTVPVSGMMSAAIIRYSETTDFRNYLYLDADCFANRSILFRELFPAWPHYIVNERQPDGSWEPVYLDAHYYYRLSLGFDYTYDIYAEWPLDKEDLDQEVTRVKALFEKHAPDEERRSDYCNYVTVQKGSYECLIIYYGDKPFEEVTDNYCYYIFAYDEEALKVRYIFCNSLENGVDRPYYLSLDW